jgi:hypothetical protein
MKKTFLNASLALCTVGAAQETFRQSLIPSDGTRKGWVID